MNSSLTTADLSTRGRIVLTALVVAMVVVSVRAFPNVMPAQTEFRGPVPKARGPSAEQFSGCAGPERRSFTRRRFMPIRLVPAI